MSNTQNPKKEEDELDSSLSELLKELNSEIEGTSRPPDIIKNTNPFSSVNSPGGAYNNDKNKDSKNSNGPKEHYTLSSFPTEMSCTQAFDQLVACYSIGGQMRHVYRYGGISYCDGRFAKLRFCLQMKGIWDEEEKAKRIARFFMLRLAEKKKQVGSSEDVWSVRTVPVNNPFKNDLYDLRDQNKNDDEKTALE